MNIGIIVFSQTGNTLGVAEKLQQTLEAKGLKAELLRVTAEPAGKNMAQTKFMDAPDPSPYGALIFAAPVQGFRLAEVMRAYLEQMPALPGKKSACFSTQQLKKAWMGGNKAIGQMRDAIEKKGAEVLDTGIVHWSASDRDVQISELTERFCGTFTAIP